MARFRGPTLGIVLLLAACGSEAPSGSTAAPESGPAQATPGVSAGASPGEAAEESTRALLQERFDLDQAELDLWHGSRLSFRRAVRAGAASDEIDALALEYARFSIQIQLRDQDRARPAAVDSEGRVQFETDLARQGEFMWVMNTEVFIVPQGEFPVLDLLEERRATRVSGGDPGPFPQALVTLIEALAEDLIAPLDESAPAEGD